MRKTDIVIGIILVISFVASVVASIIEPRLGMVLSSIYLAGLLVFWFVSFALKPLREKRHLTVRKPDPDPAAGQGFDLSAKHLKDMTAHGLHEREKNIRERSIRPKAIWETCPAMESTIMRELEEAVLESAANGNGMLNIAISAFDSSELMHGVEVDRKFEKRGDVEVTIRNFNLPGDFLRPKEKAFNTSESMHMFADSVKEKVSAHFNDKGLNVKEMSFPNGIKVSWMDEHEYDAISQAVRLPGGYEAYKAGVPADDIVA